MRREVCYTIAMSFFPRNPIDDGRAKIVCDHVQKGLVAMIDLALTAKQAHWTVYGRTFLSVHEKLDDVVETARDAADTLAERMAQLGHCPDGRVPTLQANSPLPDYPACFQNIDATLKHFNDALLAGITTLREIRQPIEENDPPTDDLIQGMLEKLEEHLWMLQAIEKAE